MHSRLLGRAAGVRSTLLYIFQANAPPLFGWVSGMFGGRGSGAGQPGAQQGNAAGLDFTFLIMLVTLFLAGLVMFRALKTYPRDVATAIASEQAAPQEKELGDNHGQHTYGKAGADFTWQLPPRTGYAKEIPRVYSEKMFAQVRSLRTSVFP